MRNYGINLGKGKYNHKLCVENFNNIVKVFNLSDKQLYIRRKALLKNYELNMRYCSNLSNTNLYREINDIVKYYGFKKITNVNDYYNVKGLYLLVFDEYNIAHIGMSEEIGCRITVQLKRFNRGKVTIRFKPTHRMIDTGYFGVKDVTEMYVLVEEDMSLDGLFNLKQEIATKYSQIVASKYNSSDDVMNGKVNALLTETEYLQAWDNFSSLSNDILHTKRLSEFVDDKYLWPLSFMSEDITIEDLLSSIRCDDVDELHLKRSVFSKYFGSYCNDYKCIVISKSKSSRNKGLDKYILDKESLDNVVFGMRPHINYEPRFCRDNIINMPIPKEYDNEEADLLRQEYLNNFDKNITLFNRWSKEVMESELNNIIKEYGFFSVNDISHVEKSKGLFILVFGNYNTYYLGGSSNIRTAIKKTIQWFWRTPVNDRFIGNNSIVDVTNFGLKDLTGIYVLYRPYNKDMFKHMMRVIISGKKQCLNLERIGRVCDSKIVSYRRLI